MTRTASCHVFARLCSAALAASLAVAAVVVGLPQRTIAATEFPKPSPYPITWELKFEHAIPKRIVVETPGSKLPIAYWYLTYTVTNKTDKEQVFLPYFEMVTRTGKVIRSDNNIAQKVFDEIKRREANQFLQPFTKIGGELRLGEDEARDGVAIWAEPDPRMGNFSIFVGDLSGEAVQLSDDKSGPMKDADGKPIILRKTLQLNYLIRGDEVFPGQDEVNEQPRGLGDALTVYRRLALTLMERRSSHQRWAGLLDAHFYLEPALRFLAYSSPFARAS